MSKKNKVDFFGMSKAPNYLNGKSKKSKRKPAVSFLTSRKPINLNKKPKKNSRVKSFNFLNNSRAMPKMNRKPSKKQPYINWNYKQIKKKFPGLNPYGDADMDGSMNYKDCKPFDASKDGILSVLKSAFSRKGEEKTVSELPERLQKKVRAKLKRKRIWEAKQKGEERAERRRVSAKQEKYVATAQKGFAAKLIEKASKGPKVDMEGVAKKVEKEKQDRWERIRAKRREIMGTPAEIGAGTRKLTRKLLYRKVPIIKKGKVTGYKTQLRKGKDVEKVIKGAVEMAGIAQFKKKSKSRKGDKTYAKAGRPSGSYKYSIPGKGPVPIHVYKKWRTEQRALVRIKLEQQAGIATEDISQAEAPTEEYPEQEYEQQEQLEEVSQLAEVSQPVVQQAPQLTAQQVQQIKQYQQARAMQGQQQARQQSIQQGKLDFGSGGVSRSSGNILNAPNVARGELRNVGEQQHTPSIRLGERPQTNPQGEMYTQVEPGTGKVLVKRRISEKFATGEAL